MSEAVKKEKIFSMEEISKTFWAIVGTLMYAIGMNLFVVSIGLYSGGIVGICQLIRTLLVNYMHLPVGNIDISGILYYAINIPVFIIGYKSMGKLFMAKTVICVTTLSAFLTWVPITAVLEGDALASCLIGGIISGIGAGLTLKMGASGGGLDILGIYMIKRNHNFSVGKLSVFVNLVVFSICLFISDVPTVIYTIIFAVIHSLAIDKIHSQNIDVEVIVISKNVNEEMKHEIMYEMGRGITQWESKGGYTDETSEVLYILLSKYEVGQLKGIIRKYDKDAFIIVKEGTEVDGNYMKKL